MSLKIPRDPAKKQVRDPESRVIDAVPNTLAPTSIAERAALGWLPVISLLSSCGLLIIAIAFQHSRAGIPDSSPLFWLGLLVIMAPIIMRMVMRGVLPLERVGLVILMTLLLYLVKVLHSPVAFTFPDEAVFVYNANQVNSTQELLVRNPILPATFGYPGLSAVANALTTLTGLPLFPVGIVVIGVGKMLLMLALYHIYARISKSDHVAGIATIIYASNPNFIFWSSEFGYEPLALPLAAIVVLLLVYRASPYFQASKNRLTLVAFFFILAVVATHHMTSYMLLALLMAVTILYSLGPEFRVHPLRPLDLTTITLVAILIWVLFVATNTFEYLYPVLNGAFGSIMRTIIGEEAGRIPFEAAAGAYVAPQWERLVGIGGILLLLLGALVGQYHLYRRRYFRTMIIALTVSGCAYFPLLGLRFTPVGWETSNRSSDFLFVGLSFVVAFAIARSFQRRKNNWFWRLFFSAYLIVIFFGGFVIGWQPNIRLPKPYLIKAGSVLREPEGISAARWMRDALGPGNKVAIDSANAKTVLSYGEQSPFAESRFGIRGMILSPTFGENERNILEITGVQYILIDRNTSWDQMIGHYFMKPEDLKFIPQRWKDPNAVLKFDRIEDVSKFYDSGNIVIYDVGSINGDSTQP